MREDERQIVALLIEDALALDYRVTVDDGEETTLVKSSNYKAIFDALATTDEDRVTFHTASGERVGFVYLVYGNEPGVVICDYSDKPAMESLLTRASALGDKFYGD